jgi:hypothetical protein
MVVEKIAGVWARVHQSLFPHLALAIEEPMTPALYEVIAVLELLRVEELLRDGAWRALRGAPPADRVPLLRAFIAQAVLKIPTMTGLLDRLRVDGALRRLCGWSAAPAPPPAPRRGVTQAGTPVQATQRGKRRHARGGVPSAATFSRAFAAFAAAGVLDRVHARRVQEYLGDDLCAHGALDGTAISAQERPAAAPAPPLVPPPPTSPKPRGRPKRGEVRPPPPPTRLQQQRATPDLTTLLAELPTACGIGAKRNSHGDTEYWIGYKLHLLIVSGDIPVVALTTSASMHDSGAAIPLMRLARARGVTVLYDVMDAAYDAAEIRAESQALGHVPVIATNPRRTPRDPKEQHLAALPFSRLDIERALVETDRRRHFRTRTAAERVNARLKDDPSVRLVRLRKHAKVHAWVMGRVLAVFALALLNL